LPRLPRWMDFVGIGSKTFEGNGSEVMNTHGLAFVISLGVLPKLYSPSSGVTIIQSRSTRKHTPEC
jgi:hypothetical protein